jgi:histidine ammonia-lyase
MAQDRYLAPDIERATARIFDGALARVLGEVPALPALLTPAD